MQEVQQEMQQEVQQEVQPRADYSPTCAHVSLLHQHKRLIHTADVLSGIHVAPPQEYYTPESQQCIIQSSMSQNKGPEGRTWTNNLC